MDVELSELRLVWPPRLFSDEAQALLDGRNPDSDMEWLLSEAFADDRGTRLLQLTGRLWQDARSAEPWESSTSITLGPGGRFIRALIDDAPDLPRYERPRYWSARQRPATPEPVLTLEGVKEAFVQVVLGLVDHGYFDEAFGSSCCDARSDPEAGQERLAELLDVQVEMWPLSSNGERTHVEQAWDEEALFDVLEALHDLVARPRSRYWHDFCGEWDYASFSRRPGGAVYRWQVNDVLARSELALRLAENGTDVGRLVHTVPDDRQRLVGQVLQTPEPVDRAAVMHAVALFRGRLATREGKRSAVAALARILEDRRRLIQARLISRDEGDLFRIANRFDIRHRDNTQQGDYGEAFLDWIFWWYLATIDLTDQMLARQAAATHP